ncbi:hypothetical protein AB0952_09090 [Streptomyces caniferus]|uniref:hypothetical protein n=1 Tax=Streptomyces caniferus TaxID=285557 RepID=UPI0034516847
MSTTAACPDTNQPTNENAPLPGSFASLVATSIALTAAVLALFDLFANGLGATAVHLVVALAVFTAVRLCVGLALAPYHPPLPDAPESST